MRGSLLRPREIIYRLLRGGFGEWAEFEGQLNVLILSGWRIVEYLQDDEAVKQTLYILRKNVVSVGH